MKFKKKDTYSIDIVKFRDIDNTKYFKKLYNNELTIITNNFWLCINHLNRGIQIMKSVLKNLIMKIETHKRFVDFYQEANKIVQSIESSFEKFEKEVSKEITNNQSLPDDKNNVFDIILLRKNLFIHLFNYVCLIYKSKRCIKRIFESEKKFEQKAVKSLSIHKKSSKHNQKQENSMSVHKEKTEASDRLSPTVDYPRHMSVTEEAKNVLLEKVESKRKMVSIKQADGEQHISAYSGMLIHI